MEFKKDILSETVIIEGFACLLVMGIIYSLYQAVF